MSRVKDRMRRGAESGSTSLLPKNNVSRCGKLDKAVANKGVPLGPVVIPSRIRQRRLGREDEIHKSHGQLELNSWVLQQ